MDVFCLYLIENYGVKAVIIATIAMTVSIILTKTIKLKSNLLTVYLPIILSLILELIYDCIFVFNKLTLSYDILYSGLTTGGLATALIVSYKKLSSGKQPPMDKDILTIMGLIEGLVDKEQEELTAKVILAVIKENKGLNTIELSNQIITKVKTETGVEIKEDYVMIILSEVLKFLTE